MPRPCRSPLLIVLSLVLLAVVQGSSGRVVSSGSSNSDSDYNAASRSLWTSDKAGAGHGTGNGCEGQTAESYHGGCAETENAIDDCWRRDPKWAENRESLADCALGFGSGAQGGKGGRIYVVTNSSDDPQFPTNGTLRYGVVQLEPLWIIFERDMKITLQQDLIFANSHKTVDGRGAKVEITGGGGLLLDSVSNIIIHSISIHDIVYSKQSNQRVRVTPNATRGRGSSGEDGIRVINQASNMWIDHCYLARCNDGALDVTKASTNVTISNNVFENHDKVMLLGHNDNFEDDVNMRVTVATNRFGPGLSQRMPRCRFGQFHVVNNDYQAWGLYAVGGSSNPTIYSEGNRYTAGEKNKEVTKRMEDDEAVWGTWNWASQNDLLLNGASFKESGSQTASLYAGDMSMKAKPASMVAAMTADAGPLNCQPGSACC